MTTFTSRLARDFEQFRRNEAHYRRRTTSEHTTSIKQRKAYRSEMIADLRARCEAIQAMVQAIDHRYFNFSSSVSSAMPAESQLYLHVKNEVVTLVASMSEFTASLVQEEEEEEEEVSEREEAQDRQNERDSHHQDSEDDNASECFEDIDDAIIIAEAAPEKKRRSGGDPHCAVIEGVVGGNGGEGAATTNQTPDVSSDNKPEGVQSASVPGGNMLARIITRISSSATAGSAANEPKTDTHEIASQPSSSMPTVSRNAASSASSTPPSSSLSSSEPAAQQTHEQVMTQPFWSLKPLTSVLLPITSSLPRVSFRMNTKKTDEMVGEGNSSAAHSVDIVHMHDKATTATDAASTKGLSERELEDTTNASAADGEAAEKARKEEDEPVSNGFESPDANDVSQHGAPTQTPPCTTSKPPMPDHLSFSTDNSYPSSPSHHHHHHHRLKLIYYDDDDKHSALSTTAQQEHAESTAATCRELAEEVAILASLQEELHARMLSADCANDGQPVSSFNAKLQAAEVNVERTNDTIEASVAQLGEARTLQHARRKAYVGAAGVGAAVGMVTIAVPMATGAVLSTPVMLAGAAAVAGVGGTVILTRTAVEKLSRS